MAAEPRKEPCKSIYLYAFRGDRASAFRRYFEQRLNAEKSQEGPGPTLSECLLYAGHVGVAFEEDGPVFGFRPVADEITIGQLLNSLKSGESFPGEVSDDTAIIDAARDRGLDVHTVEFVFPDSEFQKICAAFGRECESSDVGLQLCDLAGSIRYSDSRVNGNDAGIHGRNSYNG